MILEKRDVMKSALQVWNEKLIPALLEYGISQVGKQLLYSSKHGMILKVMMHAFILTHVQRNALA